MRKCPRQVPEQAFDLKFRKNENKGKTKSHRLASTENQTSLQD
jgi:hypothetical protein